MIFDIENWLWKSDLGIFDNPFGSQIKKLLSKNLLTVDPCLQNSTSDVMLIELSVDYKKNLHNNLRLQKCIVLLVVGDSKTSNNREILLLELTTLLCGFIGMQSKPQIKQT